LAYPEPKRPVVLIVEDKFLIRMDAVDMIKSAGFDVVEAENSDEAIAILERRLDITVVFTDVQMPGSMDGLKLAAAVRGRWPPIKIVATSGMAKVGKDDLQPGSRFPPKPYSAREIVATLRKLSDPPESISTTPTIRPCRISMPREQYLLGSFSTNSAELAARIMSTQHRKRA